MSLGTMSIDRREDYYRRIAHIIAGDPIDFYARASRGREIQARFPWIKVQSIKPLLRLLKQVKT